MLVLPNYAKNYAVTLKLTSSSVSRSRSLHVIRLELNLTKLDNLNENDLFLQLLVQCNGGQLERKIVAS